MHAAPAVRVSLGRSAAWAAFAAASAALACGNVVAWGLLHAQQPGAFAAALGAASLCAAAVGAAVWRARPFGELRWDGDAWHGGGISGQARVVLDLGPWMLLRLAASDGPVRWLAASRRATTGDWPALRAALHAPSAVAR